MPWRMPTLGESCGTLAMSSSYRAVTFSASPVKQRRCPEPKKLIGSDHRQTAPDEVEMLKFNRTRVCSTSIWRVAGAVRAVFGDCWIRIRMLRDAANRVRQSAATRVPQPTMESGADCGAPNANSVRKRGGPRVDSENEDLRRLCSGTRSFAGFVPNRRVPPPEPIARRPTPA